jgi:hypothetical protein
MTDEELRSELKCTQEASLNNTTCRKGAYTDKINEVNEIK